MAGSTNGTAEGGQLLTLPQLAEAAGVEYRTIHTWVQRGLISPTYVSRGPGTPNLFLVDDAFRARIIGDLRRAGLDLDALQRAADSLRDLADELEDDAVLIINGRVEIAKRDAPLSQALTQGEPAVVYGVTWARKALNDFLAEDS